MNPLLILILVFSGFFFAVVDWQKNSASVAADTGGEVVKRPEAHVAPTPTIRLSDVKPKLNKIRAAIRPAASLPKIEPMAKPLVASPSKQPAQAGGFDLGRLKRGAESLRPFLDYRPPQKIMVFEPGKVEEILPEIKSTNQQDANLYLASNEAVESVKQARSGQSQRQGLKNDEGAKELKGSDFEVVWFRPGRDDNQERMIPASEDYRQSLRGPDYTFIKVDERDEEAMYALLSRVLSLGHGGELMIKVKDSGYLSDGSGADFKIFENAFRVSGNYVYQEFAEVGVSMSLEPGSFRWFDCNPDQGVLYGCVGAVPSYEGGDLFDLGDVKLEQARYIWIRDLGHNKNLVSKDGPRYPTEGADLDAIELIHAYKNE